MMAPRECRNKQEGHGASILVHEYLFT